MFFIDRIFPPHCVFCRTHSRTSICDTCQTSLPWLLEQPPDGVVAPLRYSGLVRAAMIRYKFNGYAYYDKILAKLIAQAVRDAGLPPVSLCTYIPSSVFRIRKRGYDQAKRLCKAVAAEMGVPWKRCLRKLRHTRSQTKMHGKAARLLNVRGAFIALGSYSGQSILLIDDIYTTGATMGEASKALLEAGAQEVFRAVGARADTPLGNPKIPSKQY